MGATPLVGGGRPVAENRPGKILSPSRQEIKTGKSRSPTVSDGPAVLTRDERVRALNGPRGKVNAKAQARLRRVTGGNGHADRV